MSGDLHRRHLLLLHLLFVVVVVVVVVVVLRRPRGWNLRNHPGGDPLPLLRPPPPIIIGIGGGRCAPLAILPLHDIAAVPEHHHDDPGALFALRGRAAGDEGAVRQAAPSGDDPAQQLERERDDRRRRIEIEIGRQRREVHKGILGRECQPVRAVRRPWRGWHPVPAARRWAGHTVADGRSWWFWCLWRWSWCWWWLY